MLGIPTMDLDCIRDIVASATQGRVEIRTVRVADLASQENPILQIVNFARLRIREPGEIAQPMQAQRARTAPADFTYPGSRAISEGRPPVPQFSSWHGARQHDVPQYNFYGVGTPTGTGSTNVGMPLPNQYVSQQSFPPPSSAQQSGFYPNIPGGHQGGLLRHQPPPTADPSNAAPPNGYFRPKIYIRHRGRVIDSVRRENLGPTVLELKYFITQSMGVGIDTLILTVEGGALLDDGATLEAEGIHNGSTVDVTLSPEGLGAVLWQIGSFHFDPRFDEDLRPYADPGYHFYRGGRNYHPPFGWYKYGLRVLGVFGSDVWIGYNGIPSQPVNIREELIPDEWPVAYFGTSQTALQEFAEHGLLDLHALSDFDNRIMSFSTVESAERCAAHFPFNGTFYKLVFKARIHPYSSERILIDGMEAWLTLSTQDVRPYGILIKEAP